MEYDKTLMFPNIHMSIDAMAVDKGATVEHRTG